MPTQLTPQAAVPDRRDNFQLTRDQIMTQKGVVVLPPNVVVANGVILLKKDKMAFRQIQNCGTLPVKFLVDNQQLCTADVFHGILAPCTAIDDGLGGVMSFGITGDRVSVFSTGAIRVCSFEGYAPEGVIS